MKAPSSPMRHVTPVLGAAIVFLGCCLAAMSLRAAPLEKLPDGREYILNEIHFALKPDYAGGLSPADQGRKAVDKAKLNALHRDILEVKAGHTCARNWLEGKPLPQHIKQQPGTDPNGP